MAPPSKLSKVPVEVVREFESALIKKGFSGYQDFSDWFGERGYEISKTVLHKHGQKVKRRMEAIKASTQAAQLLAESVPDEAGCAQFRRPQSGADRNVRPAGQPPGSRRRRRRGASQIAGQRRPHASRPRSRVTPQAKGGPVRSANGPKPPPPPSKRSPARRPIRRIRRGHSPGNSGIAA